MRKLIAAVLVCVGLVCLAQARPGPDSNYNKSVSGGFTPSCTPSTNFLARAAGITLTADKTNYDNLICGLNTDGVLAKLDALYIFAAPDSTTAKLNLVQNAFNGTTTLSFSASHGFTGDGATAFDTGFTPNAGGSQFALNGASLGVYILTSNTTENIAPIGSFNSAGDFMLLQPNFGNFTCAINENAGNTTGTANSQGFWQCVRTNSTTEGNSKNGAALTTGALNSGSLDNVTLTVFCRHDGAGATYVGCTTDQMSASFIGGALTNTDVGNLSSRVNTFMTAYSINVY